MEIKICANCANHVWKCREQQVPEVCISCHYRVDGVPSAWKPIAQTNADRIRAMTDEELAESLSKTVVDAMCYSHSAEKSVDKMPKEIWEGLVKGCLEWLKQPAEVEDNA